MMNEIERKAVELLREEFAKVGISEVSLDLPVDAACVRAISRALAALVAEARSQQHETSGMTINTPAAPADWSMTYAERKATALLAMHNAIGLDYARAAEDLRKEQARQQREGHDHG